MVSVHDRPKVERTTRYVMLCKLSAPSAEEAWRKFARRFNQLPESLRQSLTYDRGNSSHPTRFLLPTSVLHLEVESGHQSRVVSESREAIVRDPLD